MLSLFFHRWERRLADVSKDRIVRPFDWGVDWLPAGGNGHHVDPQRRVQAYVDGVLRDTHAWFTPAPTTDYEVLPPSADGSSLVRFPSALTTPHPENNRVTTRFFPARVRSAPEAGARCSSCRSGTPTRTAMSGCAGCWRGSA